VKEQNESSQRERIKGDEEDETRKEEDKGGGGTDMESIEVWKRVRGTVKERTEGRENVKFNGR